MLLMLVFSAQAESLKAVEETVKSNVDVIRFGSEFCERKIPSLQTLKAAYRLTEDSGKRFIYVTPRLPGKALEKVRRQLKFLTSMEAAIVVNDLGLLNVLTAQPELDIRLGRQLIFIPARCPWKLGFKDFLLLTLSVKLKMDRGKVADLFHQTNLNYKPTIEVFRKCGVKGVDLDWIPECFRGYRFLTENGLKLSVHLYLVPVAVTRKCHSARFLGEKRLDRCGKPCYGSFFRIVHDKLGVEMFLHGNVVFRLVKPKRKDLKKLLDSGVSELVIPVSPIMKTLSCREIDGVVENIILLVRSLEYAQLGSAQHSHP